MITYQPDIYRVSYFTQFPAFEWHFTLHIKRFMPCMKTLHALRSIPFRTDCSDVLFDTESLQPVEHLKRSARQSFLMGIIRVNSILENIINLLLHLF